MFELRCHAQKVSVIATKSTSSSSSKKRKHLLSRRFWSRLVVVRLVDTTTTLERPREKRFDVQSFDHKTTRDREIRKKIGFSKRRSCKSNNAQYLPGDRVVEILRLPGKGEFDYDAKKRRREERCCCCGSKRGSVFGRHVSFCEEAFLCVWQLETLFFVHFYLDLSPPRSSSSIKNESFLRFPRDAILSLSLSLSLPSTKTPANNRRLHL